VGGFDRYRTIPDVSEGKEEKDSADRPILYLEQRFFGRGISEIRQRALAGREPVALNAG
jgi:hypothetical protein